MSFLDKIAFWKKKDDLDDLGKDLGIDKDLGLDMGAGPSPDLGMSIDNQPQQPYQKYPSFQQSQQFQPSFQSQPVFQQQPSYNNDNLIASKNLEVISSKLDALRATMESINQRLANIEAIARGEQEDTKKRRYY